MDHPDGDMPRDTSINQAHGAETGYYRDYAPQRSGIPPHLDRTSPHQSSSGMTSFVGRQPGPSHSSANRLEEGYPGSGMQPSSPPESGYDFSQGRDYRHSSPYGSINDSHHTYYNHSRPLDGSNQEIPFTSIMQRSDALSPMNLPAGYNYPPASDNYSESRRPTLTQQGYQQDIAARRNADTHPTHPTPAMSNQFYPLREHESLAQSPRFDTQHHTQPSASRERRTNHSPYERRDTIRPSMPGYSAVHTVQQSVKRQSPTTSDYGPSSMYSGSIAIPQVPYVNSRRQDHVHPSGSDDLGHSSRSLPAQSPTPFWPSDYSLSSMGTPAYTEGSADPAQSDQEEFDAHTSTSPTTSTSTSTSASSTASRWARFRVPQDIFTNPPDPARHELYHRIRQEPWFVNQHAERHLAPHEAERIPGSTPGESVLLAFYDRIVDHTNKAAMRCTICAQTNPGAQLYPRPDRAKVHMRHHFELRPIPCNRACKAPECTQRFFTHSDLTAHVSGKTEPLATCPNCDKTMRQKNLKRHMTQYCQALNRR